MLLLSKRKRYSHICPYLPEQQANIEYFFATHLTKLELTRYFSKGWRKFGTYYFKNNCPGCQKCIPLRIPVKDFKITKSYRRILKKCQSIQMIVRPLEYRDEIFEIYSDHSWNRFQKESNWEDFINSFYASATGSLQSEYYLGEELIAVGFLDCLTNGYSSAYFIYKTKYSDFSLGNFSILKEIEYTRSQGLKYYYLGYYIAENHSMAYKNYFYPNQKMDWKSGKWQ